MTVWQIILAAVGGVVLLAVIWWLTATALSFRRLRKRVRTAYKQLCTIAKNLYTIADRALQVLSECEAEYGIIVEAKESAQSAKGAEAKAEYHSVLRNRLKKLLGACSENETAAELFSELTETETEIFKARRQYNSIVREYNCKRKRFPDRIAGALFRFKLFEFYTADEFEAEADE